MSHKSDVVQTFDSALTSLPSYSFSWSEPSRWPWTPFFFVSLDCRLLKIHKIICLFLSNCICLSICRLCVCLSIYVSTYLYLSPSFFPSFCILGADYCLISAFPHIAHMKEKKGTVGPATVGFPHRGSWSCKPWLPQDFPVSSDFTFEKSPLPRGEYSVGCLFCYNKFWYQQVAVRLRSSPCIKTG